MHIGLIALDERPVNVRYPVMIADIAGVRVSQPPEDLRGYLKSAADSEAIGNWLLKNAEQFDALIVSIETLGYGGLILSRITSDRLYTILKRLDVLRTVKQQHPDLKIYGFNVITRISYSDDTTEEPDYWAEYGPDLYRFSQLYDQQLQGQDVALDLEVLKNKIPAHYRHDFVKRRMRNHAVNLATLEMLVDSVFDLLVISSDDTSAYGFGTREKRWLAEWIDRMGGDARLLMYPGADEVGAALLARVMVAGDDEPPKFAIRYGIEADKDRTAQFEDGPASHTVERQVKAVGGVVVDDVDAADFIIAVNPPSPINVRWFDYRPETVTSERENRTPYLAAFAQQMDEWIKDGKHVIVTDLAYPNGSDPVLIDALRDHVDITKLAAYGGWNTAGNTVGVALAQGIAAGRAQNPTAQMRFLLHRFVEDWGYQHVTRQRLMDWLEREYGTRRINDDNIDASKAFIEGQLADCLSELPGFAGKWRLVPGSVRLPWARTFEVDFDLERVES